MKEYKEFRGEFKKHAHQIIEDMRNERYSLQSIQDLMINKMECTQKGYPLIIYSGSDTKDAIAYNSKGDAKIILDSTKITEMNYQTKFKHPNTSLQITDDEWEEFSGEKVLLISKNKLRSLNDKRYHNKDEILNSKEWNFLARDSRTLSNYFDFISNLQGNAIGIFPFSGIGKGRVNSLDTLCLNAPMYLSGITERDLFNGTNTFIGVKE